VDTDRDTSMMGARTDAGDVDEDIIDSKQLYMKFMDMVGKKQINIIHQSQAKKDNTNTYNNPSKQETEKQEEQ
jgi:hypothetical protein